MPYLLIFLMSFGVSAAECCYTPKSIDLFETPYKKYNFEFEFKEPTRDFEVFILLNVVDAYTTYRGLQKKGVREANPLLGNRPTVARLALQKTIGTYYVHRYVEESELKILNKILLSIVMLNLDTLNKVEKTSYQ